MTAHEISENRADRIESGVASNFSSMLPELMQNDVLRQLKQSDSKAVAGNGFPQLELVKSGYETGAELSSARELKQAGLNPKDVKHKVEKEDNNTTESTSVKYPNGLDVTVTGRTKHMPSGNDVTMDPEASVKEPLPKGYRKDEDGAIFDAGNKKIAQINDDGTVTVKVAKQYLTQGPAGVTEATVSEKGTHWNVLFQ